MIDMNPYKKLVSEHARLTREAKEYPLGGFEPRDQPAPAPDAPVVLIFSPHPDDECIVGALPLRLMRQCGARVQNVAVTLGSDKARQPERLRELKNACRYMGYGLIETGPNGLEKINLRAREKEPDHWGRAVNVVASILKEQAPCAVFFPHAQDWNSTHIGVHYLARDALERLGPEFQVNTVETEYWGAMDDPNLMAEASEQDVADLVTGTSFHVGEVKRNPFHILQPAWMQDNVRRGSELVGGQGGGAPDFLFAALYRWRRWNGREFEKVLEQGRLLPLEEAPGFLLET